jgi:hypothetical protein
MAVQTGGRTRIFDVSSVEIKSAAMYDQERSK